MPPTQLPAPPPPGGLARSACHEFDTHVDMDLLHGDLSSTPVAMGNSVEECCRMCVRTAGCKGLTLTPSGDCWLKSSISAPTKQRGLISATRREAKSARAADAAGAPADTIESSVQWAAEFLKDRPATAKPHEMDRIRPFEPAAAEAVSFAEEDDAAFDASLVAALGEGGAAQVER